MLGTTLVITVATVVGSLLADVLYAMADPRIRFGSTLSMTRPDDGDPVSRVDRAPRPSARRPMAVVKALSPTEAMPEGGEAVVGGGIGVQILRVFVENKLAVVGLIVIVFMVLFCFVGPLFYHTNQTNAELRSRTPTRTPRPGTGHPLGTDGTGFDILGRLMYGGQASSRRLRLGPGGHRRRRRSTGPSRASSAAGSTPS